jgi:hypothetical protein
MFKTLTVGWKSPAHAAAGASSTTRARPGRNRESHVGPVPSIAPRNTIDG